MERLDMESLQIVNKNLIKIRELFPECVSEDGIDFSKLKQELSDDIIDDKKEKYQLTWPGKRESLLNANKTSTNTVRPLISKSVDYENTQNIYIEGDNLEALKILQESYLNKIKCIYIDPPYNTGNDFIYNDKYEKDNASELVDSGQIDEDGNRLVTNPVSNGRFHSDWLSMIYPRLKLARNLLSDDGVIFISIDDNELKNLLNICDEIFGENNFVATIPWRKRTAKSDVPFGISQDFETIVCYAKTDKFKASIDGKERKYYETPDFPNRPWRIHDLTKQTTASERPNSYFTIINPNTGEEYPANPNATWRITKDTIDDYLKDNRIVFPGDYDFLKISKPVLRYWKEDDMQKAGDDFGKIAVSTLLPDNIGMSQDGTKEITNLFDKKVFNFPKPTSLIKYLLNIINDNNCIVLDFFSGSATTAHAVMQLNAEDGGNRKYILIQLAENCDENSEAFKAGYKNICELGEERIKRASKRIKEETNADIDYGFRVYKVDSSNMKEVFYKPSEVEQMNLLDYMSNIKEDRTSEDLLTQVMLDLGLTLDLKIEEKTILSNKVFYVEDNSLVACFDEQVDINIIDEICKCNPMKVVFKDISFKTDKDKINLEERIKKLSPDTEISIL